MWSVPKPHSMFGVPVEVDANGEGWAVRMKPEQPETASRSQSSSSLDGNGARPGVRLRKAP